MGRGRPDRKEALPMNAFNRLVVIVLLILLVIITAIVAIVPDQTFWFLSETFDWLQDVVKGYMDSPDRFLFATGRVLVGGAVAFLCLVVLWLELRRPRKKTIRAQKLAGGEAYIATESIEQRLAYNIDQLPDVIKVNPRITGRSRGVDIDLLLETSPDVDIPMKTEEVIEVTREVIGERMGLKLGKVMVKIKHAPYPRE
jgi:hypothetical protein